MRLLRFIVTSLAVIASLIGALALVIIGLFVFVLLRLFGRPAVKPRFQARFNRQTAARPAYSDRDDVIDVTATPVKDLKRL